MRRALGRAEHISVYCLSCKYQLSARPGMHPHYLRHKARILANAQIRKALDKNLGRLEVQNSLDSMACQIKSRYE